jgi:hypothetical protein
MSIRDQERQTRQLERRISEAMRRADREVGKRITARAHEASLRAEEVKRRIERGDVQPRPLPSMREDSLEPMESMPSMESSPSMNSMEPAHEAHRGRRAGFLDSDPFESTRSKSPGGAFPRGGRAGANRGTFTLQRVYCIQPGVTMTSLL